MDEEERLTLNQRTMVRIRSDVEDGWRLRSLVISPDPCSPSILYTAPAGGVGFAWYEYLGAWSSAVVSGDGGIEVFLPDDAYYRIMLYYRKGDARRLHSVWGALED